jgi:branched-chain amino acid transport system ATP-binding protein
MQAVMSLSDDVYVLNQGRIIAHGSPRDIASNPEVIQAYLGRRAVAHA